MRKANASSNPARCCMKNTVLNELNVWVCVLACICTHLGMLFCWFARDIRIQLWDVGAVMYRVSDLCIRFLGWTQSVPVEQGLCQLRSLCSPWHPFFCCRLQTEAASDCLDILGICFCNLDFHNFSGLSTVSDHSGGCHTLGQAQLQIPNSRHLHLWKCSPNPATKDSGTQQGYLTDVSSGASPYIKGWRAKFTLWMTGTQSV